MQLADLELIDKLPSGFDSRFPGEPYAHVSASGAAASRGGFYISKFAVHAMDLRPGEGLRFAKYDSRFYAYRCEPGIKGSYALSSVCEGYDALSCACGGVIQRGLSHGEYMMDGPTHLQGVDLFELVPIEEYRERQKEQAA